MCASWADTCGCLQQGAMMNEAFQAREGLPPDLFPDAVPTYTGHYHKPHTVSNTSIRYVGSPYQSETADRVAVLSVVALLTTAALTVATCCSLKDWAGQQEHLIITPCCSLEE